MHRRTQALQEMGVGKCQICCPNAEKHPDTLPCFLCLTYFSLSNLFEKSQYCKRKGETECQHQTKPGNYRKLPLFSPLHRAAYLLLLCKQQCSALYGEKNSPVITFLQHVQSRKKQVSKGDLIRPFPFAVSVLSTAMFGHRPKAAKRRAKCLWVLSDLKQRDWYPYSRAGAWENLNEMTSSGRLQERAARPHACFSFFALQITCITITSI